MIENMSGSRPGTQSWAFDVSIKLGEVIDSHNALHRLYIELKEGLHSESVPREYYFAGKEPDYRTSDGLETEPVPQHMVDNTTAQRAVEAYKRRLVEKLETTPKLVVKNNWEKLVFFTIIELIKETS